MWSFELLMSIIDEYTQVHYKIDRVEHLLEVGLDNVKYFIYVEECFRWN